jgi:hypothetical protein
MKLAGYGVQLGVGDHGTVQLIVEIKPFDKFKITITVDLNQKTCKSTEVLSLVDFSKMHQSWFLMVWFTH